MSSTYKNCGEKSVSIEKLFGECYIKKVKSSNSTDAEKPKMKVESCKRFRSLKSERIVPLPIEGEVEEYKQERVSFYKTLLKYGLGENVSETRRQGIQKDEIWQNEFKDLLWLELQAWQYGRTATQHDEYLCEARKSVQNLLDDIMHYRFNDVPNERVQSSVTPNGDLTAERTNYNGIDDAVDDSSGVSDRVQNCECLAMFCLKCIEQQNVALKQVESLLNRLDDAQSLYPSSKAFGLQYPLVLSESFQARVKALCIWYNMTKHHRLTVLILGRHLMQVEEQIPHGDISPRDDIEQSADGGNSADSGYSSNLDTGERHFLFIRHAASDNYSNTNDDCYDTRPILNLSRHFVPVMSNNKPVFTGDYSHTYRKYIRTVLKTKGLLKALSFLEKLDRTLLHTAQLTLEKPSPDACLEKKAQSDGKLNDQWNEELELRQYGYFSPVAQDLNLPSYRAAFVFISRVPLDAIHAFLQMRLETKPEKPSELSIRQLLGELKDGLHLAMINRKRFIDHFLSVLWNVDDIVIENFNKQVEKFDSSVRAILEVYLDYLKQWIQMIHKAKVQKNVLEEEWNFVLTFGNHIPSVLAICGKVFCKIAIGLLGTVCSTMKENAMDLINTTTEKNGESECVKHTILLTCRDLQCHCCVAREKSLRILTVTKLLCRDLENNKEAKVMDEFCSNVIRNSLAAIQESVLDVLYELKEVICMVNEIFAISEGEDDIEAAALQSRLKETIHQLFKFGFEYFKEVVRCVHGDLRAKLTNLGMDYAEMWMDFVQKRYERGRGLKPRWATQGLEFLLAACEPENTNHLHDGKFEEFKNAVEKCISFIFGTKCDADCLLSLPNTSKSSILNPSSSSSSSSSSTLRRKLRTNSDLSPACDSPSQLDGAPHDEPVFPNHKERMLNAIEVLDKTIEESLKSKQLIGNVCQVHQFEGKNYIKPRTVTFSWQRGIKIGQGRFGKVYTAVNSETGELLAMKEIQLQPFDHKAIRSLALELRIFEGIVHQNLVRYYGVEVHKEEMLIFMELCPEGTLENLVSMTENGLPEGLVRRYMKQLVDAVDVLHQNTIVHRDIKSANIFLACEGNILKLGDFGSAVKIKAHTTVPGELRGFVGTQAYMAPEVFMENLRGGHGRAVDIWSLGCVLVEISSGRRPWSEYESNYQIIFKVGMGETPMIPDNLSDEGHHFASLCFQHNPRKRATTSVLLDHTFLKVDVNGDDSSSCSLPTILEDYWKLGAPTSRP